MGANDDDDEWITNFNMEWVYRWTLRWVLQKIYHKFLDSQLLSISSKGIGKKLNKVNLLEAKFLKSLTLWVFIFQVLLLHNQQSL